MQRVVRSRLVGSLAGLICVSLALAACVTPQEQIKPGLSEPQQPADKPSATQPADSAPTQTETQPPATSPSAVANEPAPPAAPAEAAGSGEATPPQPAPAPSTAAAPATAESAAMFTQIAAVLQYPRCLNCHVSGNSPKQGDERRIHMPQVERGVDGRGSGLKCKMCHTEKNGPVAPGAPDWRLAPVAMAWEGLSAGDLCRALTDQTRNGGRDAAALATHLTEDPLVLWGWTPGGARKPVPIAQAEFARLVEDWSSAGMPCPQ